MPSPLNYETPIIELNKDTVRDTYGFLEEKMNSLNIKIIAMKSFIEDQMLILRQSRKDSTQQKSSCDHNSETARLTEKIAYLRNENRTKSCCQTLLEDDNAQQKPPAPNKSDIKVPSKYVRSSENHSANNKSISTCNRYQELSNNDDVENESNTGDYVKSTKAADPNKTKSGKKIMTQEKNQQLQ